VSKGRCRSVREGFYVEPEKKCAVGEFTFAELGENEEDLAELEARYVKAVGQVQSSADASES
jgi:hypothetical protein